MKNYNFEKIFKLTYKNISEKLIFTHFLFHLPGPSIFQHLLNIPNFTGWFGVGPPGLGGIFDFGGWVALYKPLHNKTAIPIFFSLSRGIPFTSNHLDSAVI